jgi:integrase/recombinase XerD
MAASTTTAVLVRYDDPLDVRERGAIAGFLAGYTDRTRVSYTTDLRMFTVWSDEVGSGYSKSNVLTWSCLPSDGSRRQDALHTVARRVSTLASFYKYCHLEAILDRNPAANVRRPKVDYESRTLGLDRNELGGLLVQAGLGTPRDHALITLLAMNGLRIAEALGADIDDLDTDRGHRTLKIVRKKTAACRPWRLKAAPGALVIVACAMNCDRPRRS